jgi:hypothetical protein
VRFAVLARITCSSSTFFSSYLLPRGTKIIEREMRLLAPTTIVVLRVCLRNYNDALFPTVLEGKILAPTGFPHFLNILQHFI